MSALKVDVDESGELSFEEFEHMVHSMVQIDCAANCRCVCLCVCVPLKRLTHLLHASTISICRRLSDHTHPHTPALSPVNDNKDTVPKTAVAKKMTTKQKLQQKNAEKVRVRGV